MSQRYRPRLSRAASRAIQETLPETVAAAALEFVTGSLLANPHRIGKPLRRELQGLYTARRGAFRVIYQIDDSARVVVVLRIEHRADVYRPR